MDAETLIVDKIEGSTAICEREGRMVEIPLASVKGLVREGDVLCLIAEGLYGVDAAATQQRRARLTDRFQKLINKGKSKR